MLKRLALRDFVIVTSLEIEFQSGFSVLTGETGAGKSILVDALQLALGSRGDVGVVREGAGRAEITAEFETPGSLRPWLDEAGFDVTSTLLLRRIIDSQGKSRAWVNGSAATVAQLREAAHHLIDIHGQHAWQGLTQSTSVRELLDSYAKVNLAELGAAWGHWRSATDALNRAQALEADSVRERERLEWQLAEIGKLAPGPDEWEELSAEHQRLSHAQALMNAARFALGVISDQDASADALSARAADALQAVASFDSRLGEVAEVLRSAQAQLQDAAHSLSSYLHHAELEPERLLVLDERLSAWITLARRHRKAPTDLHGLWVQWKNELLVLDTAADLQKLQDSLTEAKASFMKEARRVSSARQAAAPKLGKAITQVMQQLGMVGGVFQVVLIPQETPQSFGIEAVEFRVSGHEGSTPRVLNKVASGGELSRIALAIAVTTSQLSPDGTAVGTLIFDEVDAGIGGAVADTVGRLMQHLGQNRQVLAVTHLPQVAACADHHFLVAKSVVNGHTRSEVSTIVDDHRVTEIARMLAGGRVSSTSRAHAEEMLCVGAESQAAPAPARKAALSKRT